jgi:rod shape-determining protein MreD
VRWLLVAILGYACLVLQTSAFRAGGLAVQIDGHWTRPDLVMILGLFLALRLEPYQVFVIGWCLGLASDLVSVAGRLGLGALLLSLALGLLSLLRDASNPRHVITQFLLAMGAVAATHLVWYLAMRLLEGAPLGIGRSIEQAVLDALYSAVLAPYLFWLLERLRGPLGVTADGREA